MVEHSSKRSARSGRGKAQRPVADGDMVALLSAMLGEVPGVGLKSHMGHVSFLTRSKVFVFTRNDGVALKLPRERARTLVEQKRAEFLKMGTRVMKEWVVLRRQTAEEYRNAVDLLLEAMAFVQSLQ